MKVHEDRNVTEPLNINVEYNSLSNTLKGRKNADISGNTLILVNRKSVATEDTEIMLSWFGMSILFRWNPLTVSRPVYSSVLRSWFLVRHLLTLHANSLSRTSRLSVCFPDIHFLVRDQQSLTRRLC